MRVNINIVLVVLALLSVVAYQLWLGMSTLVAIIIILPVIMVVCIPMKADAKLYLCLIALGLVSAVPILKSMLGLSTLAAIAIAILAVPVMATSCIPSMSYSLEADLALKDLIKDLRIELVAEKQGILEFEGVWGYGWPKVVILFESKHALEEAQTNGFLNQLACRITDVVKNNPAYGPNRKLFDPKEAVWGLTEGPRWDDLVAKRSFP